MAAILVCNLWSLDFSKISNIVTRNTCVDDLGKWTQTHLRIQLEKQWQSNILENNNWSDYFFLTTSRKVFSYRTIELHLWSKFSFFFSRIVQQPPHLASSAGKFQLNACNSLQRPECFLLEDQGLRYNYSSIHQIQINFVVQTFTLIPWFTLLVK